MSMDDPSYAESRAFEEGVDEMMAKIRDYLNPNLTERQEIQLRWSVRWALQGYRLRVFAYLQPFLQKKREEDSNDE